MTVTVTSLGEAERARLIDAAIRARASAYAKYSQFTVGAAILADDGTIYSGANVENASYGLTICAERVAVHTAVAAGQRKFVGLAVATSGGLTPCGACRQVLAEFCVELPIVLVDVDQHNSAREVQFSALLPECFRLA